MNWVRLYRAMYLKTLNDVSREQRPSLRGRRGREGPGLAAGRPPLAQHPRRLT